MRVKNFPTRRIRRSNSDNKSDKIINISWNNPPKSENDRKYVFFDKNQNNPCMYEALNLEMKKTSISLNESNNNNTAEYFEVLDLSMKNKQSIASMSTATELSTTSSNKKEFKDMYLYKILTNQQLLDDLKKSPNTSESTITNDSSNSDSNSNLSCQYCKRHFETEKELIDHSNITRNIITNKVSCCACQKTFSQKRYLKYHQRCHSDRNKFTCDICRKKYSRLDNLTRHNIFHTNPNKFQCSYCDRTFARKDLLNKHIKGHENKNRYRCDICQKTFKGPITLKNHNRILHATE